MAKKRTSNAEEKIWARNYSLPSTLQRCHACKAISKAMPALEKIGTSTHREVSGHGAFLFKKKKDQNYLSHEISDKASLKKVCLCFTLLGVVFVVVLVPSIYS